MFSDNPLANPKFNEILQEMCELISDKHELYLIIAFIRMFYQVKTEYDEKMPNLKIIKH